MNNTLENDDDISKQDIIHAMGKKLQAQRKKRKLSLDNVMDELKLNMSFLEALESGDWSEMPGDIYAIGFLRQYAKLLDLNLDSEIQHIKSHQYELTKPVTYPDAPIAPNRSWVIAAVLLFILINIMVNLFDLQEEDTLEVEVHSQDTLQEKPLPLKEMKAIPLAPSSPYTEVQATPTINLQEVEQENMEAKILISTQSYVFFAVTDDVWMQVYQKQPSGDAPLLLREALLKSGESLVIQSQAELLFTAGKPLALEVSRNGQIVFAQGSLGLDGKVLKLQPIPR